MNPFTSLGDIRRIMSLFAEFGRSVKRFFKKFKRRKKIKKDEKVSDRIDDLFPGD